MSSGPDKPVLFPGRPEPPVRWDERVGAVFFGTLAGGIPGTVLVALLLHFVGIELNPSLTLPARHVVCCAGAGAMWGLIFPRPMLIYGQAIVSVIWPG